MILEVMKFMQACDQSVNCHNENQAALYKKLIVEEKLEFDEAVRNNDKVEQLDACCDSIWVTYGYILSSPVPTEEEYERTRIALVPKFMGFGPTVFDVNVAYDTMMYLKTDEFLNHINYIWTIARFAECQGWRIEDAYAEVTRSNMAKVDPTTGKVIKREDGKVLKPEGWTPPNLVSFV